MYPDFLGIVIGIIMPITTVVLIIAGLIQSGTDE